MENNESELEKGLTEMNLKGQKSLNFPVLEKTLLSISIPLEGSSKKQPENGYVTSLDALEHSNITFNMLDQGSLFLIRDLKGYLYVLDQKKKALYKFGERGGVKIIAYSPLLDSLVSIQSRSKEINPSYA